MSAQKQGAHAGALCKRHEKIIKPNNDNKKMKKNLFRLFALLFVASTVFTACDNDERVTDVTLNRSELTLTIGETERLTATVVPAGATNREITWASSNPEIVAVNNGFVRGESLGTATITVTTVDGAHTATAIVTVIMPATGVTLDRSALEIIVGETETLIATVLPETATNTAVIWTSDDETVATVNNNGVVTAVSRGTTTITVTTADGDFTANAGVRVFTREQVEDAGVVINGLRWATRNVGAPGTFADNSTDAGMFYQWNRRQGWSAITPGEGIAVDGWDYSPHPKYIEWKRENDPCPFGWRVPTQVELLSLRDAGSIWTTQNEVNGRLFGSYPYQIFLPVVGWRDLSNGRLTLVGTNGRYWSSMRDNIDFVQGLYLHSTSVNWFSSRPTFGHNVRCVAID